MGTKERETSYADGVRTARHSISKGVPRWISTSGVIGNGMIHLGTGLPLIVMTAPPGLVEANESFAKGHNDEIVSAIGDKRIAVDFRPLLLTRSEIESSFKYN